MRRVQHPVFIGEAYDMEENKKSLETKYCPYGQNNHETKSDGTAPGQAFNRHTPSAFKTKNKRCGAGNHDKKNYSLYPIITLN